MKYEVRHVNNAEGIEVSKLETVGTPGVQPLIIALIILEVCFIFLIGAALYSLWQDDFTALKEVMKYVSTPVGTIIGYYFGVKNVQ